MAGQWIATAEGAPGHRFGYLRELWAFRDLAYFLARRTLVLRSRQTILGVGWMVLRPLLMTFAFWAVFRRLSGLSSGEVPYSLLVLSGVTPWLLCSTAVNEIAWSIVGNAPVISKVYFPRLILPICSLLSALFDCAVHLVLLFALMLWFGVGPGSRVLALPLFLALGAASAFGIGLWLSVLHARFRDVGHALPFVMQLWLYLSPVGYSSALVPAEWRSFYFLNPIAGVLDGMRWALLGPSSGASLDGVGISVAVTTFLLVSALFFFVRSEGELVDGI